jgi:ubiquinone/menaquinone biosynthesis C-methylase UbiE
MDQPPERSHSAMLETQPARLLASLYSASAREYATLWGPVIQPLGERLVAAMPLTGASTILDLGAGTGALFPALQAAAPGALVIGVDRADGMLHLAQAGASEVPLVAMDLEQLGVRSRVADAAVIAFVLFLLPDPAGGLAEIRRVLKPGGVVGLTTWGQDHELPGAAIWTCALDAHGAGPDLKPAAVKRDTLMNSADKIEALLDAARFAPSRLWVERLARHWTWPALFHLGAEYGASKRRLDTLEPGIRHACLARVREELAALATDQLLYRPEVIFAVGRRRR